LPAISKTRREKRKIVGLKKTLIIINPKAGKRGRQNIEHLFNDFLDPTIFDFAITNTAHKGHAILLAKEAVEKNFDLVIGVGGDGTINEIAQSLVHSNTVLGIVPVGSGNGLARHLTLPLNVKEAIKRINRFKTETIDAGMFNGKLFLCTAGLGFEGEVSKRFANSKNRGFVSYSGVVFKSYNKFKPFCTSDKKQENLLTICVANASQYGNNTYIAPKASIQDGLLDLIGLERFRAINLPHIAWQLFRQTIDRNHMHRHIQIHEAKMAFDRMLPAHVDGEYIGDINEFETQVIEKCIHLIM
jgi:diacylglycerol kinase (ATP)